MNQLRKKKLKILFILNSVSGGATQGIVEFLKTCPKDQITPYVLIPDLPNESQQNWLNNFVENWAIIPLYWWNRNLNIPFFYRILVWSAANLRSWFRIKHIFQISNLIKKWNIDVVYTGTILNIEGAIASKLTGRPHFWHIKETFGSKGRVKFLLPDFMLIFIILYFSRKVLVMTDYIRTFFGKYKNHPKIVVIYDGVPLKDFKLQQNTQELRTEIGLSKDEILIGMVASLSSTWKNHQVIIETAALMKGKFTNIKFAAFGNKPERGKNNAYNRSYYYFNKLNELVKKRDLQDMFIWAGFQPNIPQLMQSLDILVHPCHIEPFGRISIEAMASGIPVVGPNTGGVAEVIIHLETGILVEPNNPSEYAKAIEMLLKDENMRDRIGKNGMMYVENNNFTQDAHNKRLIEILSELS